MLSSLLSFGFGSETFEFPAILDDNFDSRLARLLDKAGVPNFTWGYKHLFDNGSMDARYDDTSDWAIPDDSLPKAKEVLDKAGFPPCKGPECFLYWEQLKFPIPDVHYHTELRYDEIPPEGTLSLQGGSLGREPGGIYLYKMSRIFLPRFFPDPPIGAPPRNDSYYTLANRAGESSYPVKRVIAARYVEAIVLLSLRDLRSGVETSNHWNDHLSFMLRHGNGIIGECLTFDDIKEPYREYVKRRASHRYASQKDDLGGGEAYLYEQWLEMTRARILPPPERSRWKRKNGMFSLERMLKKYNIPYDESDLALEYI